MYTENQDNLINESPNKTPGIKISNSPNDYTDFYDYDKDDLEL